MESNRWVEVSPSQFPHEAEGLLYLKDKLPFQSPYRVWSNFEFRDDRGGWHEVDALLLGRGALHVLELKYYSGRLTGNDTQWLRDGKRAEQSPLLLARRKAQYLASKLKDALYAWAGEKGVTIQDTRAIVPFVSQAVFLHHPSFTSELPDSSAIGLYGLDENEATSRLPGISRLLNEEPRANAAIGQNQEAILAQLMDRIGLVQRREREAGSWIIEDSALDEGPGWQDWRGYHKVAKQEPVRIRFQTTPQGIGDSATRRNYKLAEHEFRLMSRLSHEGLLRPRDLVDSELGVGLVYDHADGLQRLDLWLAEQGNRLPLDQRLSIIRQLGDALDYAHRNRVVHRSLGPKAVWVKTVHGQPKVLIGDWQSAGLASQQALTGFADAGVTSLLDSRPDPNSADAWLAEAFEAPEGRWQPESADRIKTDVFSLGALAYYILTNEAPAASAASLKERLRNQSGLDLSLDLPEVTSNLRSAVLGATCPAPSERFTSVSDFLDEMLSTNSAPIEAKDSDPLDATPGDALADGRFTVLRRLGRGSTALGLLVSDTHDGGTQRVLKVAVDTRAAQRLHDEAAVLRTLSGSRMVKILEGPIDLGDRSALLLESAGEETLGELLRGRKRLSLDLLERFGGELLDALIQLDKAGVDHRDIKPGNVGIRAERGAKHLVLFDFSLSRAAASDVTAGTPPYLDPFLGGGRSRFDSAAERYSAAVVLFEMAAGHTPYYGDPFADPASVTDDVTIEPNDFDRAVAKRLESFFRTALARDAKLRHDTAAEMLDQWRAAFPTDATTAPENADELADQANSATPLYQSGLSARALSAVEPLGVSTVGDLMAIDPVRLNALRGVAHATKREVATRAGSWRARLSSSSVPEPPVSTRLPSVVALAEIFVDAAGTKKAVQSRAAAGLMLGTYGDLDAFATQAQLGANLPNAVTAGAVNQLIGKLHNSWAEEKSALSSLRLLADVVTTRLKALGGVAAIDELTEAILVETTVESQRTGENQRIARGLLRIILDRQRALKRADADEVPLEIRRRDGSALLIADDAALLDIAERLGREADSLLSLSTAQPAIVSAERVHQRLSVLLDAADVDNPILRDRARLAGLAARISRNTAASGNGELHPRNLSQVEALKLTLGSVVGPQRLSAREIADRVSVRFPAVPSLPVTGRLGELLKDAGLELIHDPGTGTYGAPTVVDQSSQRSSRLATGTHVDGLVVRGTQVEERLRESVAQCSFLALGVRADRSSTLASQLVGRFGAQIVDVTALLMDELLRLSQQDGFPSWEALVKADAKPENHRATRGVAAAVNLAIPVVETAIFEASRSVPKQDPRPALIVEASPLVRYGQADLIRKWSDLATHRGQAIWVVLPQVGANQGPLLDGVSVQTSPNQYLRVETSWIDEQSDLISDIIQGATS